VARALADRLGTIDPAHGEAFKVRADEFSKAVDARVPAWKEKAAGAPGVVFYHKDGNYLAALLGAPILGYVEPLPGIPPTAQHLKGLVDQLKGKKGVVVFTDFQSAQGPEFLARELGWPKTQLPLEVALDGDTQAYLALIDRWVSAVAQAKP
jgi:zinc/manganese transport system substrate-binding protein